jgi:hypothetical protein
VAAVPKMPQANASQTNARTAAPAAEGAPLRKTP